MAETILKERLHHIFEWYKGMVSEKTGRLIYIYDPEPNTFVADGSPIRAIASVWDMEIPGDFLNRQEPAPVIAQSLEHYSLLNKGDRNLESRSPSFNNSCTFRFRGKNQEMQKMQALERSCECSPWRRSS